MVKIIHVKSFYDLLKIMKYKIIMNYHSKTHLQLNDWNCKWMSSYIRLVRVCGLKHWAEVSFQLRYLYDVYITVEILIKHNMIMCHDSTISFFFLMPTFSFPFTYWVTWLFLSQDITWFNHMTWSHDGHMILSHDNHMTILYFYLMTPPLLILHTWVTLTPVYVSPIPGLFQVWLHRYMTSYLDAAHLFLDIAQ